MAHNLLIAAHAVAGVTCFVAGVVALRTTTPGSTWFRVYLVALIGLVVFLLAAVVLDWSGLDGSARVIYTVLFALGLYMLWRAVRASARLHGQRDGWRPRYVDDIGFTLISLFDGFVIVLAIDLGAPGWLVALIAVAGVAAGIVGIRQAKARLATG
jgi:hypothetical protein